ncbi:hypothetical protein ACSSS7_001115 [Eimeria intestinalis]
MLRPSCRSAHHCRLFLLLEAAAAAAATTAATAATAAATEAAASAAAAAAVAAAVVVGHPFRSFGSHCVYPVPYCSVACAIGANENELRLFLGRFRHLVDETLRLSQQPSKPQQGFSGEESGKQSAPEGG